MDRIGQQLYARGQWAEALHFFEQKLSFATQPGDPEAVAEMRRLADSCRQHLAAAEGCPVAKLLATSDLYAIAGVPRRSRTGSELATECRQRYRATALKVHPDKTEHPRGLDAFRRLKFAVDVLSNPEHRAKYDAHGIEGLRDVAGRRNSVAYALWEELALQEQDDHPGPDSDSLPPLSTAPARPAQPPGRAPVAVPHRRPGPASVPSPQREVHPRAGAGAGAGWRPPSQQRSAAPRPGPGPGRGAARTGRAQGVGAAATNVARQEHERAAANDREFASLLSSLRSQGEQAATYQMQSDVSRSACDPLRRTR